MSLQELRPHRLSGELFTEISKTLLTASVLVVCQCIFWLPRDRPLCRNTLQFSLGIQGTPKRCLGPDWELWHWMHVFLHQPMIRQTWITPGSDLGKEEYMQALIAWIWLASERKT